jgi:hypothetical protein
MTTHDTPTWLDEALASYQPSSMTPATWERFRVDASALVRHLSPADPRAARKCLSRLTVFLADVADARPEATLDDLLTREQVQGHLGRALADGATSGTIVNRQGTLNALLRVKHGTPPPVRAERAPERRLQPHSPGELLEAAAAALATGAAAGADFARAVACVLAGVALPTRTDDRRIELVNDAGELSVDGHPLDAPELADLPSDGVRSAEVERGRGFARREFDFRLDLRRAALTALTVQVRSRPALEVLTLADVGRDRLTAAAAACEPADPAVLREVLRTATLPTAVVGG